MSMGKLADESNAVIARRRKSAAFFDWPDKGVKEWDITCELLRSMHAGGDYRFTDNFDPLDDDWPDCVIRDRDGAQVGIEITELVDQEAVAMCERGMNVYRVWSDQAIREKIAQILQSKDRKAHHGG